MVNKSLLNNIIEAISPSGREDALLKVIHEEYKDIADDFIFDNQGSMTTIYNKDKQFKIMLAAHADEISLVVNGYNSNGELLVTKNGVIYPKVYVAQQVKILTDKGIINGVIGNSTIWEDKEKFKVSDLRIDIGATSEKEAKEIVPLGSYVVINRNILELANNNVAARAFDDRLGVFITQEAAKKASRDANCQIMASCLTGEETTGRGAYSTTSILKPDCVLVVDVTYATDYSFNDEDGDIKLGEGGVICKGSIPNRVMNGLLEETAKEVGAKVQFEVWPARTGTDGDTIIKATTGVPVCLFSIPLRYMHSCVEVANYNDIESMIDVIANFILKFDETTSLIPFIIEK